MPSTDDRVVQMQFDNAAFEQKVASTVASLDKLKTSLDFANANKGLGDISASARSFDLSGIATALEGISGRFTAMGAVAFSVISNITNRAVDAGIQLGKSLSLEQVMSGFQEYQTNMNSIQTILANTKSDGSTLDDVNAALDKLNEYSDKTIYNFSQMARNIGTFTAAGVGLDDSVNAIKGIANLAAISGSSAEQASGAMYQLSQALAAGRVNLMDWQSVVSAGMGGEIFKKALFETGKALGTINDVPLGATFEEWEAKGGTFRDQMKSGWLTADVLKTTLGAFSGDLDVATLKMLGFSDAAAQEMIDLGSLGQAAATEVKTLTQLVSTVKESVGSGWAATFRIIVGDFEEAKGIFTAFNTAIGKIVGESADKRNKLLQGWKDFGGRNLLIESIVIAFKSLASIINTVKSAFSDVFPPMTSYRLFELTQNLRDFLAKLQPTQEQLSNLRHIFVGVFSALSIGWEVVKGVFGVFKDLFDSIQIFDKDSGGALKFFADLGDKVNRLRISLVEGGGIAKFFDNISESLKTFFSGLTLDNALDKFVDLVTKLKDAVFGLFGGTAPEKPKVLSDALDVLGERFGWIKDLANKVRDAWGTLTSKLEVLRAKLGEVGDFIKENFGDIPQKIADSISNADYDQALDTVNTGLLAGVALLVRNFLKNDLGISGFFNNINKALSSLTGTLDAMQTKLKAEALFKIASALALLTGAVVVLSLVNSGDLTKAMTAMAIGFGQLVTAMAVLSKITSGPMGNAGLAALATGLVLLSGAMLVLSFAAKSMADMDWSEMGRGLAGVMGLLTAISLAVGPISENSSGLIRASIGIGGIAIALNIMVLAVKGFASMDLKTMAQGLAGVVIALDALVSAVNLMPDQLSMVKAGVGILAIGVGLNFVASATMLFATLNWEELGKGLAGVGAGLLIITAAMKLMSKNKNMAITGAGLLMVGIGLVSVAEAVKSMSTLSWEEMAKGLAGLAGSMGILAIGLFTMSGSLLGSAALVIASFALGKLADVLKKFSNISWDETLHGLGVLGLTFAGLAIGTAILIPLIPAMMGLGSALLFVGAGAALFGVAAFLFATAFGIIATAGSQGVSVLLSALKGIIELLPEFISSIGEGLILLAQKILEALPAMIASLSKVIAALLQLVIDNIPKLAEALKTFILESLKALDEIIPQVVATGLKLLLSLLKGIADNIAEITTTVIDIIVGFLDAVTERLPELTAKGAELLVEFLKGIANNIGTVVDQVVDIILNFVNALTERVDEIVTAGADLLAAFLKGIADNISTVATSVGEIITSFITAMTAQMINIIGAGVDMIVALIKGVGNAMSRIVTAGVDTLIAFLDGLGENITDLVDAGWDFVIQVMNGISDSIDEHIDEFRDAGLRMAGAIVNGLTFGLAGKLKDAGLGGVDLGNKVIQGAWDSLSINSPSKEFMKIGGAVVDGLTIGLSRSAPAIGESKALGVSLIDSLRQTLTQLPEVMSTIDNFTPTIRPVLDLGNVISGANQIGSILGGGGLVSGLTSSQAAYLAGSVNVIDTTGVDVSSSTPREITFQQNNYSPTALSTADIYRQTRNQIALAKEELSRG